MTNIQVQTYKNSVSHVSETHNSHTKHTVVDVFTVSNNHAPLNYSGQVSKSNLQVMILIYLWPSNKVRIIKPGMNC